MLEFDGSGYPLTNLRPGTMSSCRLRSDWAMPSRQTRPGSQPNHVHLPEGSRTVRRERECGISVRDSIGKFVLERSDRDRFPQHTLHLDFEFPGPTFCQRTLREVSCVPVATWSFLSAYCAGWAPTSHSLNAALLRCPVLSSIERGARGDEPTPHARPPRAHLHLSAEFIALSEWAVEEPNLSFHWSIGSKLLRIKRIAVSPVPI